MAEKTKAELLAEVEQLSAKIDKIASESGQKEILEEKDSKISELEAKVTDLEAEKSDLQNEVTELTKINNEISLQNETKNSSDTISIDSVSYKMISKKFFMDGKEIDHSILSKDGELAIRAKELNLLTEVK